MPRRKKAKQAPPVPPGEGYVLVRTKEGSHWRRKRGTVKPAKLNESLKTNTELTSITSPIAKRIFDKLAPYLKRLDTGRFIANVSTLLNKHYKRTGKFSLCALNGYVLQTSSPWWKLMISGYWVKEKKGEVFIEIDLFKGAVKKLNSIVSHYFFEAILLHGDLTKEKGLRIESEASPMYNYEKDPDQVCKLNLILPAKKTSWLVMLRLSCIENNELATHYRHHGAKIILAGTVGS